MAMSSQECDISLCFKQKLNRTIFKHQSKVKTIDDFASKQNENKCQTKSVYDIISCLSSLSLSQDVINMWKIKYFSLFNG